MMWKYLLTLFFVVFCDACTEPGRKITFADFARRSEIVVLAEYVDSSRIQKSFKVTKLFSKKRDNLLIGSIVSIKTSSDVSCTKSLKVKTKYILFLKKSNDQQSYEFHYKPVLASFRNHNLFFKIIKGTWSEIPILISGCRKIPKPMNGFVSYTKNKVGCLITCKKGFQLEGKSKNRKCDQKSGVWYPKQRVECIPVPTESELKVPTTVEPRVTRNLMLQSDKTTEDSVLQRLSLLWRRRQFTSTTPAINKATEKPLTVEERKQMTSQPPSTATETERLRWIDYLNSPPAILRAANAQHDDAPESEDEVPREENRSPVVLGSDTDITWLENGVAVVTGKGDEWEGPLDPRDPDSLLLPYKPLAAPNDKVYGCPSFEADVLVYSSWQDGFSAQIKFPPLPISINSDWRAYIKFSHPLTGLDPSNAQVLNVSMDHSEVFLGPNPYNRILHLNEELHIGLIGRTDPEQSFYTTGKGKLLGGCVSSFLDSHVVGTMFDSAVSAGFQDPSAAAATTKVEKTTTQTTTKPTPVSRKQRPPTTTTTTTTRRLRTVRPSPTTVNTTKKPKTTTKTTTRRPQTPRSKPSPTKKTTAGTTTLSTTVTTRRPNSGRTSTTTEDTTTTEETTTRRPGRTTIRPSIPRFVKLNPLKDWEFNRCRPESPNGLEAEGGNTEITIKVSRSQLAESNINYNDVLYKSNLFYEAQRSGMLKFNRIPWRGQSGLKDGCDIGKNLTGGWFNDGGHVKSTYPIAFATTLLSWGYIEYKDAYQQTRENQRVMANIKWAAKYLIACHIGEEELVAQIGNYMPDKEDWSRPEEMKPSERTVYVIDKNKPSPEIVAETVAALSAAGIVFKLKDPAFSKECLSHAKQLHSFAIKYKSDSFKAIPSSMTKYAPWPGSNDDLSWASVWLAKATNSDYFLEMAETYYKAIPSAARPARLFYWDDKTNGAAAMLGKMTKKLLYKNELKEYVNEVLDESFRTPLKQVYLSDQAPNQHTANSIFLALVSLPDFASKTRRVEIKKFASEQMGILLGTSGRSFVVGCGPNPPKRPHHMASSCGDFPESCTKVTLNTDKDNPHILYGAMVAGPDKGGKYEDSIKLEIYNDVSVVINAGFQSAAAGMKYFETVEYKKQMMDAVKNETPIKKTQI